MKSLIVAISIAVTIIFVGIYSTEKLNDISVYLTDVCEEASSFVEKGDYKRAGELAKEMEKCVEDNYNMLAASIDHNEVDKIEMNIKQMKTYIEERQKADALAFGNVLLGLFEHLPKDYKLKIENIL